MTLADHVRTLGRGPGRSRSLTTEEACDAMRQMLTTKADSAATGAILMLLRMKGETAEEIAGFTRAAQEQLVGEMHADLDWPSYAAGRTRGLPWFLLSAKLVALSGYRVVLHGWNGADDKVRKALGDIEIPTAKGVDQGQSLLEQHGIVYLPLETVNPALFALLQLREVLGLRSCVNTVCRMLNPASARASVQGVFHPSYRLLQADAAQLLGWENLTVIKGGGGEFERHPSKSIAAFGLRGQAHWEDNLPSKTTLSRRLSDGPTDPTALKAMWEGQFEDAFAKAVVVGTASAALNTLGAENPDDLAEELWSKRLRPLAA